MRILRVEPCDATVLRQCHEVAEAARVADDPFGPPESARALRTFFAEGWEGNPCEAWAVAGEQGEAIAGWCWLQLPDKENLDNAVLMIVARPDAWGSGLDRALLRHAAQRARASGRSMLTPACRAGTPAFRFFRSAGATPGHTEVRRVLDLRKAQPGQFTALRETAAATAAGYSLITWTGATPGEQLAGVAQILNAMNDAPHEERIEDAFWDADRVRERADSSLLSSGVRGYSVAAVHDETGEMAGLTQVEVNPDIPEWGGQGLTAVTRPHRGHRLGLLIKSAMLEWLAAAEPQLERIETGNADSNRHMIAVNEALGYEVLDPPWEWLELRVDDALRASASQ